MLSKITKPFLYSVNTTRFIGLRFAIQQIFWFKQKYTKFFILYIPNQKFIYQALEKNISIPVGNTALGRGKL